MIFNVWGMRAISKSLLFIFAKINNNDFDIALIPHTLKITNFGTKNISDSLNLEIDIVAKYVENFSKPHTKNV